MVRARSTALMPVVMPSRASTLTVKAVCMRSVFSGTICVSPRRDRASSSMGTHSRPLQWVMVKATSSGVARSAANTTSPSFSRSSSSTTTTALPAAISAIARSTVSSWVT